MCTVKCIRVDWGSILCVWGGGGGGGAGVEEGV